MGEANYCDRLAARVHEAWSDNPSLTNLHEMTCGFLAAHSGQSEDVSAKSLQDESRDRLQEKLVRLLVPPQDLESRNRKKAVEEISIRAAQLARLNPEGWKDHVLLLQKRCGRAKPVELPDKNAWEAFLDENGPTKESPSTEEQRTTGISANKIHETVALLQSFTPVVAKNIAYRLTTKPRLKVVFDAYGFDPNLGGMEDRLAGVLNLRDAPPHPIDDKKSLEKWPRTLIGSFAADLATVVEYPPSVWMLERELSSIERASEARMGKKHGDGKNGGSAKPVDEGGDGGSGDGGGESSDGGGGAANHSNHPRDVAWRKGLIGLCFSGGGIRSATFNLGVLQGLAKRGMIPHLDYLSTVSGGGYIGTWLISWINRLVKKTEEVAARLSPGIVPDPDDPLLRPIGFLRKFSNYLTPKTGFLSADTWVLGVTWLRNTLLNLLVLVPALLSILFLPRLLQVSAMAVRHWCPFPSHLPCIQFAILILVICLLAINLNDQDGSTPESRGWYTRPWWIRALIVLPMFPLAWSVAVVFWKAKGIEEFSPSQMVETVALGAGLALLILFVSHYPNNFKKNSSNPDRAAYWTVVAMILIPLTFGGAALLTTLGLRSILWRWAPHDPVAAKVTVWGAPLVILAIFLLIVFLMGLMGRNLGIPATIWLGRLKTYMVMYAAIWMVWVGLAVYGSWIVSVLWSLGKGWVKFPAIAAWAWTTLQTVMAGNDSKSSTPKPGDWKTMSGLYLTVGPYVFIIGLMLALSYGENKAFDTFGLHLLLGKITHPFMWAAIIGFAASSGVAWLLSFCIDVNQFSMNTFYRTRLARCYLGATNDKRRPMAFTGYDPNDDNVPLSWFMNTGGKSDYDGPYPIYNATLNLVHGEELAWQERKGASFVFTPDLCGYETPWDSAVDPRSFRNLQFAGYRETSQYAFGPEGMHLATPMSISGAAASPNMGFYSGSATAFLMTLFNVRLGWWLGNPRHKKTWKKGSPRQGLAYLVKELLGLTDDRAGFVYVSDGGHFENLAIYELVRRRCRYIVACDAEEDATFGFEGLGNAIRKCREDFGVEIDINVDQIKPDPTTGRSKSHCAVGKVYYPDQPGWGYLVYIKASLVGDEPADVLEYRVKHPAFPHQSTADQWFTESQFESYRRLGLHITKTVFREDAKTELEEFSNRDWYFTRIWDRWYPPSEALQKNFTRHAAAYDALVREMRSDPQLRFLDDTLFNRPGLPIIPANPGRDMEKEFLFLTSLFQLMENVYLDLDLENNADHPDNAGWMAIFSKWTQTITFRTAWDRCGWTYGRNFQFFCNRLF